MRGLPILFLLVLAQASFSFADVITFNTNAACATAGGTCAFYDNSTWVEEVVPGAHDTAIIHTTAPVTLSLDPVSLPSKSWTVWEINMTGPVTLLISNISFDVTELTWDETSSVSVVEESSASLLGVVGYGSIYVKDSFLNVNIMSVSSGEIVSSTLQTVLPKSSVNIDTLNISDSYTNVVALKTNYLHATGDMFFGYAQVYVNTFGTLVNIPNLYMSTTLVVSGDATVNIIDCNTSINAVTMQISSTLNFSTSSPANTASIGTYQSYSASLILNDNVRLTLGGNYVDDVIFGNNAVLNIVGTTYIKSLQQAGQVTPGTINISDTLQIQQALLSVPVQIYLAPTGIFSAPYNVTMTPNAQGICGISGPGRLMITGGYFQCLGQLNVGQITVGSYLSVSTLNTSALTAGAYGSIVGNVVLSGEDAELDFFYGSTTFIINGGYTQQGGAISVSMNFVPVDSLLQVHGKLSLEDVDVDVYVQGFEKGDEFNLAESTHKIEAKFGDVEDLITQTHEIYAYVEGEFIVVQDKKEGFVKENWPWLIVVGVLTIIWILLMVCLHKCTKDSKRTFDDPHESISAYLKGISIKKMTYVDWAFLIILSVILVPLLVEAAAITLVLAALIPIGFIFGLIEHRFVFVWAVIVLFAQLGSVLDLFADIILIAKFLVFYIQTQWNSNGDHTPTEWDKLEGQELQLFFARLGMTLGGALMSLLMVVLLQGSLGTLLDKISGVKFFTDGKANNKTVSTGSGPVFAVFVLAAVSFWKVFLVAVRLHLLIQVAKSLWKNGKLEEKVQRMVTWIEMFFYFDLMWSGIPLGVLTGLELFVYKEDFELDPETVFEILKLSALVVDLVSASFLFYYTICGLIKKVPCLHHAHHEHHEHHDDESPHHHAKHATKHAKHGAKHDAKHDAINISASEHDPLLANKK